MMKKVLFLLISFSLTLNALSTKELARCINLAGKQRMLTQMMCKEALLIKQDLNKSENIKKLLSSSKLFDKTLKGLQNGDSDLKLKKVDNKDIQKELKDIQEIWDKLYKDIGSYSYEKLIKENNHLLLKCESVVKLYTKLVKEKSSKRAQALNLSGKERMLTQKIAKSILLKNDDELKSASKLYEKILNGLLHSDKDLNLKATKLSKIKKALKKANKEYKDIKFIKKDIDKLDKLLITMETIVKLYEKSINKEKKALKLSSIINDFINKKSKEKHIINLAGKQRMLTQKITKDAIILKSMPSIREDLINSYKLYDKTLLGLLNGDEKLNLSKAKDKKVVRSIKEIQSIWTPFKSALVDLTNGNDKKKEYIIKENLKLLNLSNTLVKKLKETNNTDYLQKARLNIVDLAGRERMLTQKMTKEKFLILQNIDKKTNIKNLIKSKKLFENSLEQLISGDINKKIPKPTNKKVKKAFSDIKELWLRIKPYYKKNKLSKKDIKVLNKKSNQLLSTIDKAVKLCERVRDY